MSDTITDVSKLPGAHFAPLMGMWPQMVDQAFSFEQQSAALANSTAQGRFNFLCTQWTSDATLARNAGLPLPPKPISPPSKIAMRQDVSGGTWIAQADGPVFGVCPDLPALNGTPGGVTGIVPSGTTAQPTQDEKLNSLGVSVSQALSLLGNVSGDLQKIKTKLDI